MQRVRRRHAIIACALLGLLLATAGGLSACYVPPPTPTAYVATPTPLPPTPTSFLAPLTATASPVGTATPGPPITPEIAPTAPPVVQRPGL